MTNQELLNRSQVLQRAAESVQTTRMRYAVQKNMRAAERELEAYNDLLADLASEHNVDINGGVPDDEEFREELTDLLQQDAGDPDVHTVPPETLDREDEKGTDLPLEVVAGIDWMIASE